MDMSLKKVLAVFGFVLLLGYWLRRRTASTDDTADRMPNGSDA